MEESRESYIEHVAKGMMDDDMVKEYFVMYRKISTILHYYNIRNLVKERERKARILKEKWGK